MPEVFAKVNFSQFPFRFWSFFCNLIVVINFSHLNSEYKTKTLQKVNKLLLKNGTKHQVFKQISIYVIEITTTQKNTN